jgi:hypothetical protein
MVPMNRWEVLAPSAGNGDRDVTESARVERRRRPRVQVHWPILLFRGEGGEDGKDGDATVETITQNLSSQGFYYLSGERFTVGEWLLCSLQILPNDPGGGESRLECRVQVVRVEDNVVEGLYGIACRTEDYRFVAAQIDRSLPGGWLSTRASRNPAKS